MVAPLSAVPFSYVCRNYLYSVLFMQDAIGQKKAISDLLANSWDAHNRDREKSSGEARLCIIWTMGAMERTLAPLSWAFYAVFL